jgi:ion channel-forming bestrophin family protein
MHTGKSYKLSEFLLWTRRNMLLPLIVGVISTAFYQLLDFKWLAIPWTVVALLGTATAFIVGFKNLQTYNRTWEARQIWGAVMSNSRAWGIMSRDFLNDKKQSRELVYRHFAWLTALRYQLRASKNWETINKPYNAEYKKYYSIPENETPLEEELRKYISDEELKYIMTANNRAGQLLSLQAKSVKELYSKGTIDGLKFSDMHKAVREFYDHQGRSERIKNFPYPRQYATINTLFIKLFCILLPFGMLAEFDKLNDGVTGFMQGQVVWLVIPFSLLISWVYTSLEQVGESTENPFEGSANDVPISQMSRAAEIDMREMLDETHLPPVLQPKNNIVL